jgi:hypothetical protein
MPGKEEKSSRVKIGDISSGGATFYDGAGWQVGEKVAMEIHVGGGIVGPFSYSLKARGCIVRKDSERDRGESVYAVAFDKGIRISDWGEVGAPTVDDSKSGQRLSGRGRGGG